MNKVESTTIKLTKKWCGLPVGYKMTLIKAKADDLLEREYAEEVEAKKPAKGRKPTTTKNRAIQRSTNE